MYCLLLCNLRGEDAERTKHRRPVLLMEVVGNIIHETGSRRAPGFSVEWLARGNEVPGRIHLVGAFNLTRDNIREVVLGKARYNIPRRLRGRGHPMDDIQLLGLLVGGVP
jgi:hypothetical protein